MLGIWNEIEGRVQTVTGFLRWIDKIRGKNITEIFDDKYINW